MNRISTSILVLALMSLLVSCKVPENTSTKSDNTGTESDGTGTESDGTGTESDSTSMAWVVSTFAGTDTPGFANGTGTEAQFYYPAGVAVDSSGNVYVVESGNHRIRKITPADRIEDRTVSTFAGSTAGFANGTGTEARFNYPYGVAVDSSGNVYVADKKNNRIRKIEYKVP